MAREQEAQAEARAVRQEEAAFWHRELGAGLGDRLWADPPPSRPRPQPPARPPSAVFTRSKHLSNHTLVFNGPVIGSQFAVGSRNVGQWQGRELPRIALPTTGLAPTVRTQIKAIRKVRHQTDRLDLPPATVRTVRRAAADVQAQLTQPLPDAYLVWKGLVRIMDELAAAAASRPEAERLRDALRSAFPAYLTDRGPDET
ncbi:hypothetical protein [Streptomyces sp. NPDC051173]|uniref:hypothetical protein n=1 Tax=Streptomyces sp. NPDC051173 TaxID=3155164 RepID=UPI00345047E4